ncbi:hypothetical protein XENTR_v10012473 [Xenopus tropicalis]|uniref:Platelet-derived growth factor subunit B n=2 Tax=Xenopus tropicalis TaxID=8364 RepID=B1H1E3_XENTR|nr:platelet-derived growth factor subunit B precursor [Xenopus tropicalis]AAI60575.1 pdgfb protein [Xenopus tropicalis]KAE8611488.1 hypothetical protein XENTR_v10012473 [Xenopus tropicalis]|eukprot:NP_001297028.1 platelet-derived growth factor subunit B precursor [Xenopus tropicalis]
MNLGGLLVSLCLLLAVSAEGDPIPEEMFKKISEGAVTSISELRRVLQIDSVDDEDDLNYASIHQTRSSPTNSSSHSRVIRSLDAEKAVIAECKPRVEVFEISRKIVDPTNANFLVWPPCVEVQRCSGCCNSKNMRCAPTRIHVRHVQVNKIFITPKGKKQVKVVVPLEDHHDCKCEPVPSSAVRIHHPPPETKKAEPPPSTMAPVPASQKEEQPLRPHKKKNRKFKHLPSKKEQRELLVT